MNRLGVLLTLMATISCLLPGIVLASENSSAWPEEEKQLAIDACRLSFVRNAYQGYLSRQGMSADEIAESGRCSQANGPPTELFETYRNAAEAGDVEAQYSLGILYAEANRTLLHRDKLEIDGGDKLCRARGVINRSLQRCRGIHYGKSGQTPSAGMVHWFSQPDIPHG